MITIFMLFTFGIGIYLGKEVFSDKKNNNTSNDNTNTNTTDVDEIKNVEIMVVRNTQLLNQYQLIIKKY